MIKIQVTGWKELVIKLSKLEPYLKDWTRAWQPLRNEIVQFTESQFDTEGKGKWAPLSPAYAAWKAQRYGQRSILELTGAMRQDLTSGLKFTPQAKQITVNVTSDYWGFHEKGTSIMPARPVFVLTPQDNAKLVKVLERYVEYSLQVNGLT